MRCVLTLQDRHLQALRDAVVRDDGHEQVAYLLCGCANIDCDPWDEQRVRRLTSMTVVTLPDIDIISSSPQHVRCRTRTFASLLKRAKDESLTVVVVHSHPSGVNQFSETDDAGEPYLVELAQNRNGAATEVGSLVLTGDGYLFGRLWRSINDAIPLDHVLVVGDRLAAHRPVKTALPVGTAFDRQALAFGRSLNEMLAGLRVGIIGCGATGSAVGMLLARLGVGRLYVVDRDFVEESNLNRLHGATMADVKVRRLKVDVFRHHVESMGIGVSVATHVGWVGEEACRDALRSCDVIFGCTDDHDGRLLLNRLAYFYLIPVIDMGFKVDVADEDPPRILEAAGRVTVLMPGTRCLLCRNTVDVTKARDEQLARVNPEEFLIRREQQYVDGDAGPSPSVVTFTTDVACMAVDELIHRITGYRRAHAIANRVRKYHLAADKHPGPRGDDDCPLCLDTGYWGRGDMNPFLDRIG